MNEHIILSKVQADSIKGKHGKYSALDPMFTPDGLYIIPERCLNDADLAAVKSSLQALVTAQNVLPIVDLPALGQPCIAGRYYNYASENSQLVKCVQSHNRTEHAVETIPALFSFFRPDTGNLIWIENEYIALDKMRFYLTIKYKCIQAHTTVTGQTPNLLPALWVVVTTSTVWTVGVAYNVNQQVTYNDHTYKCLQAHTSQAGWTPPAVPSLWQLVS